MPTTINEIKWYTFKANTSDPDGVKGPKEFAGPFFAGKKFFTLPSNPDETDRIIAVITAVESGHYDAINMYDRAIVSVGLIQYIELLQFSVSEMLGAVADGCGIDYVLTTLKPAFDICDATFKKNSKGNWRFFFNDGRGEVSTSSKSRQLFLGCNGLKSSWTPKTIIQAKTWAACIANIWENDEACKIQREFTRKRLKQFVGLNGKATLFDGTPDDSWHGALRAAYYSFAVNSPLYADMQIKKAVATLKSEKWSAPWCIGVLKQLTFGSGIAFWPVRYNSIRPKLEKLWGIELPKTAKELSEWKEPKKEENVIIVEDKDIIEIVEQTITQTPTNTQENYQQQEVILPPPSFKPEDKNEESKKEDKTNVAIEKLDQVIDVVSYGNKFDPTIIGFIKWLITLIVTLFLRKGK